jgi:hypothetical protein
MFERTLIFSVKPAHIGRNCSEKTLSGRVVTLAGRSSLSDWLCRPPVCQPLPDLARDCFRRKPNEILVPDFKIKLRGEGTYVE